MYVLDSSAVIELASGIGRAMELENFLGDKKIAITPFSIYEVYFGLREKERPIIESLLLRAQVLDYTCEAAVESILIRKHLQGKGEMVETIDLFIASVCKSTGNTLVSLDHGFKRIEGLSVKVF